MSYFEFIVSGDLTPAFEEKTNELLSNINQGLALYAIQRYMDEEIAPEKKRRTLVIVSPMNIWEHIYGMLKGLGLEIQGYNKQRII